MVPVRFNCPPEITLPRSPSHFIELMLTVNGARREAGKALKVDL